MRGTANARAEVDGEAGGKKEKKKKKIHSYTDMYACIPAYLPFVFYKPEVLGVRWGRLRVRRCFMLTYFMEVLLFVVVFQFLKREKKREREREEFLSEAGGR